jgi:Flp pilus assembly protein TadD
MILPLDLLPLYPYPRDVSFASPVYFLPILLVLLITAVAVAAIRKSKTLFAAWMYFLITLLPVLGIVQVGDQSMADRYTYLPSVGPFLLAGLSSAFLLIRSTEFEKQKLIQRFMLLAGMGAVPCMLAYATMQQIAVWKDSFVLWDYTIRKNPSGNPFAYNSRGLVLRKRGQLDEAIADFEKALAIRQDTDTLNNLGIAYYEKGLYEKAVEVYRKAVLLSPGNSRAYTNLGVAYAAMGRIDLAIENFRLAISLSPDNSTIYNNLARALRSTGRIEEAEENYRKAVALNPFDDMAFLGLGSTSMALGRLDEALEAYRKVIELSPNNSEAYRERGIVYAKKGDMNMAAADFRMACALGSRESCGYLMHKP